jgi:hypothetical protein
MPQVLIYAQDRGGAQILALVARQLQQDGNGLEQRTLVHPLAAPVFQSLRVPSRSLRDMGHIPPLSQVQAEALLREAGATHLVCTVSSPYLDRTNENFILAARSLGIPSLGLLDHWKGFDRFLDDEGRLRGEPDHLGCIDSYCFEKLVALGLKPEALHLVGHPYLEFVAAQGAAAPATDGATAILLVSQPKTVDRSFDGIFFLPYGKERVIDVLARELAALAASVPLIYRYRHHPKENGRHLLPEGLLSDGSADWEAARQRYHIFVGLDSMALVEAAVAGKFCVILDFPAFAGLSDGVVPYDFGVKVKNQDELAKALEDAVSRRRQGFQGKPIKGLTLQGSLNRTLKLLQQFIQE